MKLFYFYYCSLQEKRKKQKRKRSQPRTEFERDAEGAGQLGRAPAPPERGDIGPTVGTRTHHTMVAMQFKGRLGRGSRETTEDTELGRDDGQRRGFGVCWWLSPREAGICRALNRMPGRVSPGHSQADTAPTPATHWEPGPGLVTTNPLPSMKTKLLGAEVLEASGRVRAVEPVGRGRLGPELWLGSRPHGSALG